MTTRDLVVDDIESSTEEPAQPSPERVRRPKLARRRPDRRASGAVRARRRAPEASTANEAAGETANDPTIEQAVENAYRVIDDYLRQGQEAASRRPGARGSAEPGTTQDRRRPFMSSGFNDDMSRRAMQFWMDAAQTWWGFMAPWMSMTGNPFPGGLAGPWAGGGRETRSPWPNFEMPSRPPSGPAWTTPPPTPRPNTAQLVSLAVTAPGPCEVHADLAPRDTARPLRASPLAAVDGVAPPIPDVHIEMAGDHLRIALKVPDDQPAGLYRSEILDAVDGAQLGRLTLQVR